MKRVFNTVWFVILILVMQFSIGYSQNHSEYTLIKRPIFQTPLTYKLTRSATNDFWGKDLYCSPRGIAKSYIMSPSGDLITAMTFELDYAWNRFIYSEVQSNWIREYGSHGTADCQFWWPRSIASFAPFDDQYYSYYHYVFVADTRNSRITRLKYKWTDQTWLCYSPIVAIPLEFPRDIDLNENFDFFPETNDYLWVVNGSDQIMRFDFNGALLNIVGESGCTGASWNFCKPTAVVSGRSYFLTEPYDRFANTNDFYVADAGNNRIVWMQILSDGQTFVWMNEVPASPSIVDLESDIFGHIWAVDRDAGTITKYRFDLLPLCSFGTTGIGENQFLRPAAITNNGGFYGFGNMSVAESWSDSSGLQYFAIGTDILDFTTSSTQNERWHFISYTLIDPSYVNLSIVDANSGALVKTLFQGGQFSGPCSFVWDGVDNWGDPRPGGNYRVILYDTSTYRNSASGLPVNVVFKDASFHHEYNPYINYTPGDVNNNGTINITDVSYLIAYVYKGGPAPQPFVCVGDVNASGSVQILDVTYLTNYLYKNGPDLLDGCQIAP